jgi:hypothetical protein
MPPSQRLANSVETIFSNVFCWEFQDSSVGSQAETGARLRGGSSESRRCSARVQISVQQGAGDCSRPAEAGLDNDTYEKMLQLTAAEDENPGLRRRLPRARRSRGFVALYKTRF